MDELKRANSVAEILRNAISLGLLSKMQRPWCIRNGQLDRQQLAQRRSPEENWGPKSHHRALPASIATAMRAIFTPSRHGSVFVRPYREHVPSVVALNLRSRLLALFTPHSGEGFP